jgi:hypothetical protein
MACDLARLTRDIQVFVSGQPGTGFRGFRRGSLIVVPDGYGCQGTLSSGAGGAFTRAACGWLARPPGVRMPVNIHRGFRAGALRRRFRRLREAGHALDADALDPDDQAGDEAEENDALCRCCCGDEADFTFWLRTAMSDPSARFGPLADLGPAEGWLWAEGMRLGGSPVVFARLRVALWAQEVAVSKTRQPPARRVAAGAPRARSQA